jgi:hypothetical protein
MATRLESGEKANGDPLSIETIFSAARPFGSLPFIGREWQAVRNNSEIRAVIRIIVERCIEIHPLSELIDRDYGNLQRNAIARAEK